jgi:hypothetical protein
MKRTRNSLFFPLLSAFFLLGGVLSLRVMAAQQPADQTDSSSTKNPSKPKETPAAPATAATPATKPATTNPSSSTTAPAAKPAPKQQTPPAKSIMVWVNTESGVYHKPGSRFYGKTKQGKYMSEADAIKAGYRSAGKN